MAYPDVSFFFYFHVYGFVFLTVFCIPFYWNMVNISNCMAVVIYKHAAQLQTKKKL